MQHPYTNDVSFSVTWKAQKNFLHNNILLLVLASWKFQKSPLKKFKEIVSPPSSLWFSSFRKLWQISSLIQAFWKVQKSPLVKFKEIVSPPSSLWFISFRKLWEISSLTPSLESSTLWKFKELLLESPMKCPSQHPPFILIPLEGSKTFLALELIALPTNLLPGTIEREREWHCILIIFGWR